MKLICAALLALILAPVAYGQRVYVENQSAVMTDAAVAAIVAAHQRAADEDFTPAWGERVTLLLGDAPAGSWRITIADGIDCFFCSGYHDVDEDGVPYAMVLAALDDPVETQITFGHELWELLVNPYIDKAVMGPRRFWALETADPVEDNQFAYQRDGVAISDFVLPAWFRKGSAGPWDFRGHTTRPRQILDGGYQLYWANGGWNALWGKGGRADGREKARRWSGGHRFATYWGSGWSWGDE